jgi:hypothetical protein
MQVSPAVFVDVLRGGAHFPATLEAAQQVLTLAKPHLAAELVHPHVVAARIVDAWLPEHGAFLMTSAVEPRVWAALTELVLEVASLPGGEHVLDQCLSKSLFRKVVFWLNGFDAPTCAVAAWAVGRGHGGGNKYTRKFVREVFDDVIEDAEGVECCALASAVMGVSPDVWAGFWGALSTPHKLELVVSVADRAQEILRHSPEREAELLDRLRPVLDAAVDSHPPLADHWFMPALAGWWHANLRSTMQGAVDAIRAAARRWTPLRAAWLGAVVVSDTHAKTG